ncbi:ABC transporter substrate-binding protein [Pseudonocardia sichuanensis]
MPLNRRAAFLRAMCAGGLALALTACGGAAAGPSGDADASGPTKVGLLIPQTGVYSPIGEAMQNAVDLYMENHDGALGGHEAEIVTADSAGNPETAKQRARELITREEVDVITGIVASPEGVAVAEEATASEVPVVIANAGANDITAGDVSPYVWRTAFSTHALGYAAGVYAAEHVSKTGAVLMGADYSGGTEVLAGFLDGYKASGGSDPIAQIMTPFGTTQNFQPYLAEVPAEAKFVYVFYAGGEAITFAKNWTDFGYKDRFPLIGAQNITDEDVLPAIGDAALDLLTVGLYSPALDKEANTEFVKLWQEKYDGLPSIIAVQTWDAMQFIDQAAAGIDGDVTPAALAKAFPDAGTIVSPRGDFELDPKSHNPAQDWYVRRLEKDGNGYVNTVIETVPADEVVTQPAA